MKNKIISILMAGIIVLSPATLNCVNVFAEENIAEEILSEDIISEESNEILSSEADTKETGEDEKEIDAESLDIDVSGLEEVKLEDIDVNSVFSASEEGYLEFSDDFQVDMEDETNVGMSSDYSDSYKSSIYYDRLVGTTLGSNQADNIVAIAASQVGYKESQSGDYSGSGAGSGDYSEYGRACGVDGRPWCAAFVTWCARKAGIPNTIIADNNTAGGFSKSGGWYYDVCSADKFPQKGDLILFEPRVEIKDADGKVIEYREQYVDPRPAWNNYMPLLSSHVGIVANNITASGQTLFYYEGNPEVKYSSLTYNNVQGNSAWVQGFVRPRYTSGAGTSTEEPSSPSQPEYTPSISINLGNTTGVSSTNATVRATLNKSKGDWISSCGVLLGTTSGKLNKLNTEELGKGTNNHNSGTGFDIWYDLHGELNQVLSAGTKYYYQFYAVCNGKTYYSPEGSFTTERAAYSFGAKADYNNTSDSTQRILLYDKIAGSQTAYIDLGSSEYIPCDNYLEAPNGRMWFTYVSSTNGLRYYFPIEEGGTIYETQHFKVRYGCNSIVLHTPSHIIAAGNDEVEYSYELIPGISNAYVSYVKESGDNLDIIVSNGKGGGKIFVRSGSVQGTSKYHLDAWANNARDFSSSSFSVTTYDVECPTFTVTHGNVSNSNFPCADYVTDSTGVTCTGNVYDPGAHIKEIEMGCAVWVIGADGKLSENGRPYITWNDPAIDISGRDDNNYQLDYNYRINFSDYGNIAGEYHVIMAARDAAGNTASVEYTTCYKPSEAGTRVNVTKLEVEDDKIVLEWDKIAGINSYNVYRTETSPVFIGPAIPVDSDEVTGSDWSLVGSTSERRFEDTTAQNNTKYYYTVTPVLIYDATPYEGEYCTSEIVRSSVMIDTHDYGDSMNDEDTTYESRVDLSDADITVEGLKDVTYTGSKVRPSVTVKYRSAAGSKYVKLVEGKDYSVVLLDNIKVGTASVTIKGNGEFTGSVTKNFVIRAKSIKKFTFVKASVQNKNVATDALKIYDGTKLLVKERDYTVEEIGSTDSKVSLNVKGTGNYTGSKLISISVITAEEKYKLTSFELVLDEYSYTGKKIKPSVSEVVCADGSKLSEDSYKVSYKNNKEAGTGIVTITGKGKYKGMLSKTFTIKPSNDDITVNSISARTYSGKLVKPAVKVYTATGKLLKKGRDYSVVYKNNIHAGTASVIVTGIGNYSGCESVSREFEIRKQSISKVKISGSRIDGVRVTYSGRVLREGVDYNISFGDIVGSNKIKTTITGMGDFEGASTKKVSIQ